MTDKKKIPSLDEFPKHVQDTVYGIIADAQIRSAKEKEANEASKREDNHT